MNPLAIPSLVACIFSVCLGASVLYKNPKIFTIIIGEESDASITQLEYYMVDGIVSMELKPLNNPSIYGNFLRIKKMRGTAHAKNVLRLNFTGDGVSVEDEEIKMLQEAAEHDV